MRKIICKKVYDTESATLLKQVTYGFFGASDGWEERLYQTEEGNFFLYTNGGVDSIGKVNNTRADRKADNVAFRGKYKNLFGSDI